jgi:hypothetical protein
VTLNWLKVLSEIGYISNELTLPGKPEVLALASIKVR